MRRIVLLAGVMIALLVQGLALGEGRWKSDGVVVCWGTFDGGGGQPLTIVPDSKGGAIIAWADDRGPDGSVYAQRVDSTGACLWDSGGVRLRSYVWFPDNMNAVSDGRGGAIVVWEDYFGPAAPEHVRAQRVDSSGVVCWGQQGQGIVVTWDWYAHYYYPNIVTDGEGGAIVAWVGYLLLPTRYVQLGAQRVDSMGSLKWPEAVLIDSPDVFDVFPETASDGQGGIIISWADMWRTRDNNYACRLDREGGILWNMILCEAEGWQGPAPIVSDGEGGGIFT